MNQSTHTLVELVVPPIVYLTIWHLLLDAGHVHALIDNGAEERIDMHGIALKNGGFNR